MHREYIKWWSPHLGREMEMLLFGHAGTPLLAFPTSLGRFFEWEDFGMVDALSYQLSNGLNMLFCVDGIDTETFYNKNIHPAARIQRYLQYEKYILQEVLPFIWRLPCCEHDVQTSLAIRKTYCNERHIRHQALARWIL